MTKQIITIGIDPGLTGAIGVLRDGRFEKVYSMPTEAKRSKGNQIDTARLLQIAEEIHHSLKLAPIPSEVRVVMEQVSANPKQGVSSMFSFGDSAGCARMFASALHPESFELVPSSRWKKEMKLSKRKAYSITRALRAFPKAREFLTRKKDEGRAEALLLSQYLYQQLKK